VCMGGCLPELSGFGIGERSLWGLSVFVLGSFLGLSFCI
jgi:hypothetical protein